MHAVNDDNPWLRDIPGQRRVWRGLLWSLVASGFSAGVLFAFKAWAPALSVELGRGVGRLPPMWRDTVASGILECFVFVGFLVVGLAATAVEGRSPWGDTPGGTAALAGGATLGAGGLLLAVAIAAIAGGVAGAPSPTPSAVGGAILFGLAVVAFQSLAEEVFFRGWLQPILCANLGAWGGLGVTSLLFGALHAISGAHGVLAVANLTLGGAMFGLLALRTGGLAAPLAAHVAWNWTESGGVGLSDEPWGSLVHLRFTGDPLWNGGPDAMNGSLATSLALAAILTVLIAAGPRSGSRRLSPPASVGRRRPPR